MADLSPDERRALRAAVREAMAAERAESDDDNPAVPVVNVEPAPPVQAGTKTSEWQYATLPIMAGGAGWIVILVVSHWIGKPIPPDLMEEIRNIFWGIAGIGGSYAISRGIKKS